MAVDAKPAPVISERFIAKLENHVERLGNLAREHGDHRLLEIQHRLWRQMRYLQGDPELSLDDIE